MKQNPPTSNWRVLLFTNYHYHRHPKRNRSYRHHRRPSLKQYASRPNPYNELLRKIQPSAIICYYTPNHYIDFFEVIGG